MTKSIILVPSFLSAYCFGQKTIDNTDSFRNSSDIPELSYAVVTDQSTLEIVALGRHFINLKDTASLKGRFHIDSNTKGMTAIMIAKYVGNVKLPPRPNNRARRGR